MVTIEQVYYEPIPTGKYPAKIKEIVEADGQFGPQLKFTFELQPGEGGESRELLGWTSQKFSNKSKLYKWTKAAFGGSPIDRSYTFKSEDLVGRSVLLTVVERESDDGEIYSKVDGLSVFQQPAQHPPPPEFEGDY